MSNTSPDAQTVETDGITVTKEFTADDLPVPAVRFRITSGRDDRATVRITEEIPESFSMDSIGFHPRYDAENWTAYQDNRIVYERLLGPEEEVETVYGLRIDNPDEATAFLNAPEVSVAPEGTGSDSDLDEIAPPGESEAVRELIAEADSDPAELGLDDSTPAAADLETEDDPTPETTDQPAATDDMDPETEETADVDEDTEKEEPPEEESESEQHEEDEPTPSIEDMIEQSGEDTPTPETEEPASDDQPEDATSEPEPEQSETMAESHEPESESEQPPSTPGPEAETTEELPTTAPTAAEPEELLETLTTAVEEADAETLGPLTEALGIEATGSVDARINHLQARVEEIAAYEAALADFLDARGEDGQFMPELHERVATVEADIEELQTLNQQLTELGEDLTALETRVQELETTMGDFDPAEQAAELEAIDDQIDELETTIADVDSELTSVSEELAELKEWRQRLGEMFS